MYSPNGKSRVEQNRTQKNIFNVIMCVERNWMQPKRKAKKNSKKLNFNLIIKQ